MWRPSLEDLACSCGADSTRVLRMRLHLNRMDYTRKSPDLVDIDIMSQVRFCDKRMPLFHYIFNWKPFVKLSNWTVQVIFSAEKESFLFQKNTGVSRCKLHTELFCAVRGNCWGSPIATVIFHEHATVPTSSARKPRLHIFRWYR